MVDGVVTIEASFGRRFVRFSLVGLGGFALGALLRVFFVLLLLLGQFALAFFEGVIRLCHHSTCLCGVMFGITSVGHTARMVAKHTVIPLQCMGISGVLDQ